MIKQLGFAEFSFPGGVHSRYLHSLGVSHLAGLAFDNIFKDFGFSNPHKKRAYRQALRLGALLHDIGHGPLSHVTEEVMPPLRALNIKVYGMKGCEMGGGSQASMDRQANHEDYAIKFITDSHLTSILSQSFPDFEPYHVACLLHRGLVDQDDFFMDQGFNFRWILSQIISSEMDVDRMDYLLRDAYFCGTNYGKVELGWLLGNLKYHIQEDILHLALDRRAVYTFDDFLLSRHHMYLMVYFHHKSIIYEEMLYRYLASKDCEYQLPSDIEGYLKSTDFSLYENMAKSQNPWARRITNRQSYKVLFESHVNGEAKEQRTGRLQKKLKEAGIETIMASSASRLSKYHGLSETHEFSKIYVLDPYDPHSQPVSIDECTEIFQKYEGTRTIERVYVAPENLQKALGLMKKEQFL